MVDITRIPITFTCPGVFSGRCSEKGDINWVHTACNKIVRIDVDGDVYCDGNCFILLKNRFIQHWRFNCGSHDGEYLAYATVSDLLYALGNASQAVTKYYSGNKKAISAFYKKIAQNITSKWEETDD